jgi:hypothetical protein
MDCQIVYEGELLVIRLSGVIHDDDLVELLRLVLEAESRPPKVPHRLTDLSELTELHLTFSGMSERIHPRRAMKFPNEFKSAIVAPDLVQFGFARMFQALNDHPQIDIRVFRDLDSARAWVDEPAESK